METILLIKLYGLRLLSDSWLTPKDQDTPRTDKDEYTKGWQDAIKYAGEEVEKELDRLGAEPLNGGK